MRYIGNKDKLLDFLSENILNLDLKNIDTFVDVFSGTGTVSNFFKDKFKILSCELLYSSYIISKFKIELNANNIDLSKMKKCIDILNNLEYTEHNEHFIFNLYSENGRENRLFFTENNGKKIDSIIYKINDWINTDYISSNEKTYLIYVLLEAVDKISNITGVYGAFLKKIQTNAKKDIFLNYVELHQEDKSKTHKVYNGESYEILSNNTTSLKNSILYLDPPYNSRQYGSNYHLLETISQLKEPIIGKSVVGLPINLPVSSWCYKKNVLGNIKKFLELDSNLIVLSYNNESHISKDEIVGIMSNYGNVIVKEQIYKRYKSRNGNGNGDNKTVIEYLFICDKRNFVSSIKSPMQWVGGKNRILSNIKYYIPTKYNNYYELFLGGGSLLFNLKHNNSFCTELNTILCLTYETIKLNLKELLSKLDNIQNEYNKLNIEDRKKYYIDIRKHFNELKTLINNNNNNNLLIVCYFLFLNKTCFNALYRENSKGHFNVPFGNGNNIDLYNHSNFSNLSKFLHNITIKNENYTYYLDKIKSGDFVYIDPPYYNTFTTYNKQKWTNNDDISVIKTFDNLTKIGVACILSNTNNEEYISLLEKNLSVEYKIIKIDISRCINSNASDRKKKANEIIVINKYCNNY